MPIIAGVGAEYYGLEGKRRVSVWPPEYLAPQAGSGQRYFDHIPLEIGTIATGEQRTDQAKIDAQLATGEITLNTEQQVAVGEGAGHVAAANTVAVPDVIGALQAAPEQVGASA